MEPEFITVFTRAHHWFLSWARCIQSTSSHPISLTSILLLFSHLRLGFPSDFFHSDFPAKILLRFSSLKVRKFFIMESSPAFYHFLPLRSKHPLSTLFSDTVNLCSYLNVRDQLLHPYKTTGKTTVLCVYAQKFLYCIQMTWIQVDQTASPYSRFIN